MNLLSSKRKEKTARSNFIKFENNDNDNNNNSKIARFSEGEEVPLAKGH